MVFWGLGWGGSQTFLSYIWGGRVCFSNGIGGVAGSSKFLPTTRKCNRPPPRPHLVINDSSLIEKSLQTDQLPTDWTTARVSSLFKKRNKSDPANYRPISLTCILCKVMEHIVASNLTWHLNENQILYEFQHGFREKRSCETQLIQLVDDLERQLIQGHLARL